MVAILFILFAGMAVGCAISMVAQRNPLYSAISLIGVFISLACLYVTLAAPFIAAVQVIVYAGAIMVLVVFVIMLLNVEQEEQPMRLRSLVPIAVGLATILFAEAAFIIFFVQASPATPTRNTSDIGLTSSIGVGLFTTYLLPFEITPMTPQLSWYLALSAVLFTIGVVGVMIKRNVISMFMCIELMLNAVNLTLVAFSSFFRDVSGQLFVFIVMTVAAAEASVGLGIIIAIFRNRESLDVDDASVLKL